MSKKIEKIRPREKELTLSALQNAAKRMRGSNQALTLIEELLTESEKITLGRRILIAQMILSGMTQAEVQFRLDVSPNTFTRTRKWLEGQIPNYGDAIRQFEKEARINAERKEAKRIKPKTTPRRKHYAPAHTFAGMRQRYPMHFLLFNIAEELLTPKK